MTHGLVNIVETITTPENHQRACNARVRRAGADGWVLSEASTVIVTQADAPRDDLMAYITTLRFSKEVE